MNLDELFIKRIIIIENNYYCIQIIKYELDLIQWGFN